jgi:PASTA domain-containing protein
MKKYTLLISCLVIIFCNTSCGHKFKSAEYMTATETVSTEQESQVSLNDGASIFIPPNSIDGKASVKIERNPEKKKNLPELPDGFVQLSDFYNFEITGANLIGPVDITIPYNTSKVPAQDGIGFALFPTQDGWKYMPVELVDGKATIFTYEIGDPLIAWHFTDPNLSQSELEKAKYICDPEIAVQAIDNGDGSFQILGRLQPPIAHKYYNDPLQVLRKPATNLPVSIILNEREEPGKSFQLFTDENGNFELKLSTTDGVREGWNWVFVNAKCDPWFLQVSVESKGYAEFKYIPIVQTSPVQAAEIPTEIPVAKPEDVQAPKSPTEYVLIPNVVGLSFETAKGFLERIGYKVIWIDGKSTLDIGQVYSQSPRAGTLTVPHRTAVVLFRTLETKELTLIEKLLRSLKSVRYESTESFNYFSGEQEEVPFYIEYQITNGTINAYTRIDHPNSQSPTENSASFSPTTDEPIDLISSRAAYGIKWWLPNPGEAFVFDEDISSVGDCAWTTTAHTWVPGDVSGITIGGNSFQALAYTTSYENMYHCPDGYIDDSAIQAIAYYDLASGLLLKSEYLETITRQECSELWMTDCDTDVGKTEKAFFEAVEIVMENKK